MPFLSIKEETYDDLNLLRWKIGGKEDDDSLIRRIVEYARCYMIIQGAEDMDEEPEIEIRGSGLGGPAGLDWIGFSPGELDMSTVTGDLYSSCPKCGAMDTEYLGTEAMDPKYRCNKCGNVFFPHMKLFDKTPFSEEDSE